MFVEVLARRVRGMSKGVVGWLGVVLAVGSVSAQTPSSTSSQRTLVDRYCVTCHNERLKTADLALDTLDLGDVGAAAATWEAVVQKLRAGMMPPPGSTASRT